MNPPVSIKIVGKNMIRGKILSIINATGLKVNEVCIYYLLGKISDRDPLLIKLVFTSRENLFKLIKYLDKQKLSQDDPSPKEISLQRSHSQ